MKNLIFIFIALCISIQSYGQNIIDKYYSDMASREDITSVYVAGKMFDFASHLATDEDEEIENVKEFLTSIHSFNMIVVPDLNNPMAEYTQGVKRMKNSYEELLRIKDKEASISFFINESNGVVYELVGIASTDGKFIVGTLMGEMELDKISTMMNKINVNSEDNSVLKSFSDSGIGEWKVYPNPVNNGGLVNIDIPESMIGGTASLFDMNGSKLKSMSLNQRSVQLHIDNVSAGQYIVELNNETVSMKKKIMVIK